MNAKKALEKKRLQKTDRLGLCFFHPKSRDKEWSEKVFYITDIVHSFHEPAKVYVSETDPSEHAAYHYDMVLTTKMKKKHGDRIDYLGYFKVL